MDAVTGTPDASPVAEPAPLRWREPAESAERTTPSFPSPAFAEPAHGQPLLPRVPATSWSRPRPRAGEIPERAAAWVVDAVIALGLGAAAIVVTSATLSRGLHWLYRDAGDGSLVAANGAAIPVLVAVPTLLIAAYCVLIPSLRGSTVGMRLARLELLRDVPGGGRVGLGRAAARTAAWAVGTCLLFGLVSMLRSSDGRAWHDRLTGTVLAHQAPGTTADPVA